MLNKKKIAGAVLSFGILVSGGLLGSTTAFAMSGGANLEQEAQQTLEQAEKKVQELQQEELRLHQWVFSQNNEARLTMDKFLRENKTLKWVTDPSRKLKLTEELIELAQQAREAKLASEQADEEYREFMVVLGKAKNEVHKAQLALKKLV